MARGHRKILAGSAFAALLLTPSLGVGRDTEDQLIRRLQTEHDPVKRAKDEINLASFKLAAIQDAYSQGHVDEGTKLLKDFTEGMKASWKTLQESGRKAPKQPQGFRELEISLRENGRALQDLERTVSYFDRAPLENAVQELDRMHGDVLRTLFPGTPRTGNGTPSAPTLAPPATPVQTR